MLGIKSELGGAVARITLKKLGLPAGSIVARESAIGDEAAEGALFQIEDPREVASYHLRECRGLPRGLPL